MASARAALLLARDPLRGLEELARDGREAVPLGVGPFRAFLIAGAPMIDELLARDNHPPFTLGRMTNWRPWFGDSLFMTEGSVHERRRARGSECFYAEAASNGRFLGYPSEMAERWRAAERVDVHAETNALMQRMTWNLLFGTEMDEEAPGLDALVTEAHLLLPLFSLPGGPLLADLPIPPSRRFRAARARVYELIDRAVAARRRERGRGGLVARMLDASAGGGGLTDRQLRDEVMSFIPAAEVGARAHGWACLLVARHPEVGERIAEEADRELDGRPVTLDEVPPLSYAEAAFREALRVYPAAWMFLRQLAGELELRGTTFPGGSLLLFSPWATHRDSRYWPDPLRFDPERWLRPDPVAPPGAYIPFALGPRRCVADRLAYRFGPLVLATLCQRWRLRPADPAEPRFRPGFSLHPRGRVEVIPEPRG